MSFVGGFARAILEPRMASAFERGMMAPRSSTDEIVPDVHSNQCAFLNQNLAFEDAGETYKLSLNVIQFDPKNVTIKRFNDILVVEAKHELKPDQHGYVSREFTRRFKIPEDVDLSSIKAVFNRNGILAIKGSKKIAESPSDLGVKIPVRVQKSVGAIPEEDATLERDEESSPTGTEYIVREVL